MDDQPTPDGIKGAAALNKGIKLLTAIADAEVPPSVRDLSDQTMLPRPTVYRLLAALTEAGLVRQSRRPHLSTRRHAGHDRAPRARPDGYPRHRPRTSPETAR